MAFDMKELPSLDWSAAPFPSDRLTVGQLRKAVGYDPEAMEAAIHNVAQAEKRVAYNAFKEALGDDGGIGARLACVLKQEHSKELADIYTEIGLVSGRHEAAEMIRLLQSWAAGEARKQLSGQAR